MSQVIKTNIKFYKGLGDVKDRIYGFITKANGSWKGCRESEPKKKIVFVDSALEATIVPNMLYHCSLTPMKEGEGFIAKSASPIRFPATITATCNKRVHMVKVTFGNKAIIYEPGSKEKRKRDIQAIADNLRTRLDLENAQSVATDFINNACMLKRMYEQFTANV